MPPEESRLTRSETLFREVNERIAELANGDGFYVVCECANSGCEEKLLVSINEYERTRQHPRRFLIAPGHSVAEIENVVEHHGLYDVVERREELTP